MNKVYLDENIFYIENFISEFELEKINNLILNAKWKDVGNFLLTDIDYEVLKEIEDRLSNVFSEAEYFKIPTIIQKYSSDYFGNKMDSGNLSQYWALAPHSDNYDVDPKIINSDSGYSSKSSHVVNGYIIYYNDNYTGGEVIYTLKNLSIRPKSRMLLVHSGSKEYEHGVTKVTEGTRYFTSGFTYDSKEHL